jgi:glycosyltransferase involved in cell wall biosynthesis
MTPLLTIGLPVYNGMPWLPETIASIRRQTYENFAVLVIDDGSSDGTAEYLRSIRDPRFHILRQENRGITATLNRMLDEVESPWLVRHDTDDVAFPQRLAWTVDALTRFPDAGMFYSHAAHYQNGYSLGRLKTTVGDPTDLRQLTQSGYLPSICHSTVVLSVDKARALGGYRFDLNVEEYDLYWRMALTYDVRFIPEVLVGYRINSNSISARSMREQVVNVLYIQYLLLSTIWNIAPQPYGAVKPLLEPLVDASSLKYRLRMREALTGLGDRKYRLALTCLIRALASSPRLFVGRILYQLWPPQRLYVGQPPAVFRAHFDELWPSVPKSCKSGVCPSAQCSRDQMASPPLATKCR